MNDDFLDVRKGDTVRIALQADLSKYDVKGKIYQILPTSDPSRKLVSLENGSVGYVIDIINDHGRIKQRIMKESQHTENKANFSEDVMKTESIPKTIQSFLNSDGGYLYIGVKDEGTLQERIIGLEGTFRTINDHENMSNDKLCDILEQQIRDTLDSYLACDEEINRLLEFNFVDIENEQILEIRIIKSTKPVFYKFLTNKKKPKQFQICYEKKVVTERILDGFYIRDGNRRKPLDTHENFYRYARQRFES